MSQRASTRLLFVATIGLAALLLAGCAPTPKASSSPSASPSATPTETATPTPSATPSASATAAPGAPAQAVTVDCTTLVSAQAMYDFNPNFGLQVPFTPASGSAAATAKADRGTACNWVNQTSGDTITITIAKPSAADLATIRATAATGTPGSGLGTASYFSAKGQSGRVDVFTGRYWLTATSVYFAGVNDASSLLTEALKSAR
jgi:hypothetical protein